MEKNWTKIRTYSNEIKSEMLKQLLEVNDIPTVVLNKKFTSYLIGKIEIYVHDDLVTAAEPLIVEFERESNLEENEN